ncbi:MAG: tetratricopeptide repeat protein [Alphaproteobacteria bacterium]|nr:tetratricopeptide repeat protein [Alphaproteobacteria bacterium]
MFKNLRLAFIFVYFLGGGFIISYYSGLTEFLTGQPITVGDDPFALTKIDETGNMAVSDALQPRPIIKPRETVAGSYLVSLHAQRENDWKTAYSSIRSILDSDRLDKVDRETLILRAMVLAMGSGNFNDALEFARMADASQTNSLPLLFQAVDAFHRKDYKAASDDLTKMQNGALSDFMMPLFSSWLAAADGKYDVSDLNRNPTQYYHAALIANYLGRQTLIPDLLQKALNSGNVQALEMERIADALTHVGRYDEAIKGYKKILEILPDSLLTKDKLAKLETGKQEDFLEAVSGPDQGVALALYDMARVLYQDFSDESALIFGNLALYLDPSLTGARILLAGIAARDNRYDEAIAQYRSIGPDSPFYKETRLQIASLLEASDRKEEALAELSDLTTAYDSIPALIQMGDLERRRDNFTEAVNYYNKAAAKIGPNIPDQYKDIFYVRGMAYERLGRWDEGEKDLQEALKRTPDDPYVLNYLGYAWADRGQRLTEALGMIEQAVNTKPSDGYITDSLGWVYYRMGEYQKALPYLEKAALLQPYDAVINDHLGDLYWRMGRRIEARFQWIRARDSDEDKSLTAGLEHKIEQGLPAQDVLPKPQAVVENAADKTF